MRIRRLDLEAFGPFSGRTITFSSEAPGLHVIFGPNEAGKSSSLRALKALLYGFPERTSDNFQHANSQLLIGGCIAGKSGTELSFFRRKKRKGDLLDPEGNPLDHGVLDTFMHGVEPALFEAIYGIDHQSLIEGGKDILSQKGEVGQALFAAGAGISSLAKILDSLETEAGELFRERGSRQKINQAVAEYRQLKNVVRENSLQPSRWKEHKKRLQEAEAEQERLEKERRQKTSEMQRLVRLNRAIPEMAKLENLQEQLREIGTVVMLPPDFSEQFRAVEQDIRDARLTIDSSRDRLKSLQARQDDISLNRTLLEHAETIEDLHQRIGEYRKGSQDRGRLEGMRITHRQNAGRLIESVRPDLKLENAELLRPVLGRKRTIQGLASRYEVLMQKTLQADKQKKIAEKEWSDSSDRLSRLPVPSDGDQLVRAITLARKAGDIDQQIAEIKSEIQSGRKGCSAELKRLGLWTGTLEELSGVTLPLLETIRRYDKHFSTIEREKQQLGQERKQAQTDLNATVSDRKLIGLGTDIPTTQNLAETRAKRQEGWRLLRRAWIDRVDISKEAADYDSARNLPEAYESQVGKADHIADRLRLEAERIARAAALQLTVDTLKETIDEIGRQEEALAARESDIGNSWQAEWAMTGIKPLPPQEMASWLSSFDIIRFKTTEVLNKEHYLADRYKIRENHRQKLLRELNSLGEEVGEVLLESEELAPLLVLAESALEEMSRQKNERERLAEKKVQGAATLEKAGLELEAAQAEESDWRVTWEQAVADVGIRDRVLPGEALDLLDTITDCFTNLAQAKELQSRIDGIDRDVKHFAEEVAALTDQAAPELRGLPPDQAALQLQTMLTRANQANELLKKNSEEIESLTTEIDSATKGLRSREKRLAELLGVARCKEAEELAAVIDRFHQYQRLQENISNAESSLAKVSEGFTRAEMKAQATGVEVDDLPGRIESLKRLIDEELYSALRDAIRLSGEESKELKLMDGSAEALEAAEKMEQVAATIRHHVDQYVKLRLAAQVLKDEIERYREENQDPVLAIASRIFSEITLGSFHGLRTDINDAGNPVLVGLRPDRSRVAVEGMSAGTCDQLYLALRLATIERRLETSEPMPLVVDDILVNFDDERSRATLNVLAGLSAKNQVILFTHHRQVVDEARTLQEKAEVIIHEL